MVKVNRKVFTNLPDALEYARQCKNKVVIEIDGTYRMNSPIVIDDSFAANRIVIKGNHTVIDCGARTVNWHKVKDDLYVCPVGIDGIRLLTKNGESVQRAQTAKDWQVLSGWYHPDNSIYIDGYVIDKDKSPRINGVLETLKYGAFAEKGQFSKPLEYDSNAEFALILDWVVSYVKISGIFDLGDKYLIGFDDHSGKLLLEKQWPPKRAKQSFKIVNHAHFIDKGEYYFDYLKKELYYRTLERENISDLEFEYPICENAVVVRDCSKLEVRIEGLSFVNTRWAYPDASGAVDLQAINLHVEDTDAKLAPPSAVTIDNADNVIVTDCAVKNCGGNGINIKGGSRNCEIQNCAIENISGSGIVIGDSVDSIEGNCCNTVIKDNIIKNIARDYCGGVGIQLLYSSDVSICGNEISDTPYTAISGGWGWSDKKSTSFNILIKDNILTNTANLLCDGAAIYLLGRQDKTLIKGNRINGLHKSPYGMSVSGVYGIYLDEGACFVRVENNSFEDIEEGTLLLLDKDNTEFIEKYPQYKCVTKMKNSNGTKKYK